MFPWDEIKARFEMGETAGQIAKGEGMPSRQAIHKRATREGWKVYEPVDNAVDGVDALALMKSGQWGKCTPENKGRIIASLRRGATYRIAAANIGITDRTLRNWRQNDSQFSALCDGAQAEDATELLETLKRMGKTDPGIAKFRAQHHPMTRDDYGQTNSTRIIGNQFNVLAGLDLGIQRTDLAKQVIEGETEPRDRETPVPEAPGEPAIDAEAPDPIEPSSGLIHIDETNRRKNTFYDIEYSLRQDRGIK